jgi:hypothetical protein
MAEKQHIDVAVHHESHGNSVAAWTAVTIIALAFLLMTISVVAGLNKPLLIVGIALLPIGAIAGKVLSAMGFGISGKPGA